MDTKNIGLAVTGSFCTFQKLLPQVEKLKQKYKNIRPIFSYAVSSTDTRFYKAKDFWNDMVKITGNIPIASIVDAEPIGPQKLLDLLIIAPAPAIRWQSFATELPTPPCLWRPRRI